MMFDLKRSYPRRARNQHKLKKAVIYNTDCNPNELLKNVRSFTMPDIGLAVFAHAKNTGPLEVDGKAVNQYRVVDSRPSFATLLGKKSEDIWTTDVNSLAYMAKKKVSITGPRLTQADIKVFCRLYAFLRQMFFVLPQYSEFQVNLADLIREGADHRPREYFRTFVTLCAMFEVSMEIDAQSERNKAFLGEPTPLLAVNAGSVRQQLAGLLENGQYQTKSGIQLMSAAKNIKVDIRGSAIDAMLHVGSPKLLSTFELSARPHHICNLTRVIHPDSEMGKSIGMAAIRALAAIYCFTPYFISTTDEIQAGADRFVEKSKAWPNKTLGLEAIAAISGRHRMYLDHYGEFLERVIGKISRFIGKVWCESKTNLHILWHQSLTRMKEKAYQKAKTEFEAILSCAMKKLVKLGQTFTTNGVDDADTHPKASPKENQPLPMPSSKLELKARLVDLAKIPSSSDRYESELKTMYSYMNSGLQFDQLIKCFERFLLRHQVAGYS